MNYASRQASRGRTGKKQHARPTIGLIADDITYEYQAGVWSGVTATAQEHDVNLISFLGKRLRSSAGFEAQGNAVYDLVSAESVDGLVIMTAALGSEVSPGETRAFCEGYRPLPVVSVGLALEGIPSVLVDNEKGLRDVLVHLIEDHGYRRIAFIRGPAANEEAEQRYHAYIEVMAQHGLSIEPDLVVPGDFVRPSGMAAANRLLDERKADLQAIVAANDEMALGALEALRARGIRVPYDMVLVGFDDVTEAQFVTPPLTTVQQPLLEQGQRATEMLLALLAGEEVPGQVVLPTKAVIRQSCGCRSPAVLQAGAEEVQAADEAVETVFSERREEFLSEMAQATGVRQIKSVPEHVERLLDAFVADLQGKSPGAFLATLDEILHQVEAEGSRAAMWQGVLSALRRRALPHFESSTLSRAENLWQQARVLIGETAQCAQAYRRLQVEQQAASLSTISQALLTAFDVAGLMDVAARELPRAGIPSCYLSLYDGQEAPYNWSRLVLAYDGEKRTKLEEGGRRFPSLQLLPGGLSRSKRCYSMVVEPLHFQENQLGFALLQAGPKSGMVYETLRGQLSGALQGALLFQQRKQAEEALEKERSLLRTLINNLPDSIYVKDTESRFVVGNTRVANIMGVKTPEELAGKTDFDFYPKELAEQYFADEREVIRSGKPLLNREEPLMELETGKKGWLSSTKIPLRDAKGKVAGLVGIGRDITERRRAEEEMKRRVVELATLNEIGRAIASAMELDQLWELIYQQTCRVMDAPAFYMAIYDREKNELRSVIDILDGKHRPEAELARNFAKGRTEYIIRKKKPLLIRVDVKKAYRRLGIVSSDPKARAFAGVPIVVGSKAIGVLAVQHYERDDAYDEHTIELLSPIASQAAVAIENARLFQAERRRAAQLAVINEVGKEAASVLDLDEMLKEVVRSIHSSFRYYNVSIFLVDKDHKESVMRAQAGAFEHLLPGQYRQPLDVGIIGWVIKTGKSRLANDVTKDPYYYKGPVENLLTNSELSVPLKLENEVIGVLSIQSADFNAFDEADITAMETLSGQIAVAIQNAQLFEETKRLATTDPLTGASNRRHLEERLHAEVARARRFHRHLSVLVMDIDNLKLFNDTYGHSVGDQVIHTIAQTILGSCREIDVVGRYGGDEFAVILPETDASGAAVVAERMIAALQKTHLPAPNGTQLPLGVSIGAASYPSDSDKADRLFSLADAAMYRAKVAGGGQFASLTVAQEEAFEDVGAPFSVLTGLLTAVDSKDHYTFKHSQDVARRSCALARAMQLSKEDLSTLELVGRLHDIGKIGIPTGILRKPGPLTKEEWKVVQEHPRLGYLILQQLPQMDIVLQALLHHHERYDGEGYPTGLHGEQIPFFARILALADAYSAMRTDRPYRKAMTTKEALEEIKRNFGKQFDPKLAQRFVKLIETGEID